jgi:hypothetical protein
MEYVGLVDILRRWIYTRRGVEKMLRRNEFPAPAFAVNAGRTKIWRVADIAAFEITHPEVTSETAKRRKQAGYASALARGRKERQ